MNESPNCDPDLHLEELVLHESLVSAMGLGPDKVQIGLRGDPSLRETSLQRHKYQSPIDPVLPALQESLERLLLEHGVYRVYIGFNSGEVRTNSIFDPLRLEIHAGEKLAEPTYLARHFPPIGYAEKIAWMRGLYTYLLDSGLLDKLPSHWRNIFTRRHVTWQPMREEDIHTVVHSFSTLRGLPELYLRNATLCIVQDYAQMQFNSHDYPQVA